MDCDGHHRRSRGDCTRHRVRGCKQQHSRAFTDGHQANGATDAESYRKQHGNADSDPDSLTYVDGNSHPDGEPDGEPFGFSKPEPDANG
jgi:hypothetical protein